MTVPVNKTDGQPVKGGEEALERWREYYEQMLNHPCFHENQEVLSYKSIRFQKYRQGLQIYCRYTIDVIINQKATTSLVK